MTPTPRHLKLMAAIAGACALTAVVAPSGAAAAPQARASIVGGQVANPSDWPYAVAIFRNPPA